MKKPKVLPLTDNPRIKEPVKIPLLPCQESKIDDSIILAKNYEDNIQNDSEGIQKLETDKTN